MRGGRPLLLSSTTALVARLAGAAALFHAAAVQALLRKANFNPNQPRVPRGNTDGGQWTRVGAPEGGDAALILVSDEPKLPGSYVVDLLEEEEAGGHAIVAHVGWTPQALLNRVRTGWYPGLVFTQITRRAGSFPSLVAANKLVNATLARNRIIVDEVASGRLSNAFVTATFSSKTGIEAFRATPRSNPYLRDTFGVGVDIVHDPSAKNGFRVITAYPRNE